MTIEQQDRDYSKIIKTQLDLEWELYLKNTKKTMESFFKMDGSIVLFNDRIELFQAYLDGKF
ncbi:hypothetical protein AKA01nite_17890 [Alkalibacterium kapii]|uniref:Uncharacterized protein n=1 Tax=Alkalibacterium kapii TaxID=426704 RepID=A0A511B2Y0_9LACT|nr:hypothetical protein AKA01nite_17890 [Alkalibacterium kapii]